MVPGVEIGVIGVVATQNGPRRSERQGIAAHLTHDLACRWRGHSATSRACTFRRSRTLETIPTADPAALARHLRQAIDDARYPACVAILGEVW